VVSQIHEREASRVRGPDQCRSSGERHDQVAGAERFDPAVDVMLRRAALDPEDLGKIVGVQTHQPPGRKRIIARWCHPPGPTKIPPALLLQHVNMPS
jgi:hypothetical protein